MKAIDDGFKEMIEMTRLEKLEATVKELAETVKHTVDEHSALCMRVNLLEEGGQIISPIYNDQYAVLGRDDEGYIVSIFVNKSGLCEYAPCEGDDLHEEHCTTMLDAMQEYQKCLRKIRSGPPHKDEDDESTCDDCNATGSFTDGTLMGIGKDMSEKVVCEDCITNSSDLAIAVANDEVVHPTEQEPIHLISSCGEVYVNADGSIHKKSELSDYLLNIAKIDMEEWIAWGQRCGISCDSGDVLEVAYWDKDGEWHEPDWDFRAGVFNTDTEDAKQIIKNQKAWIRTYRKQPEPEPKRFKIYGDEYPEIWAHFKGKDYNPKFEEELIVQFHNHRESRDH